MVLYVWLSAALCTADAVVVVWARGGVWIVGAGGVSFSCNTRRC